VAKQILLKGNPDMKRIYIANKITGMPDENRPWFAKARDMWTAAGWKVQSPHDLNPPTGPCEYNSPLYNYCMKNDIYVLLHLVDAVALGPDWQRSPGARLEATIAKFFKLEIYDAETMKPLKLDLETTFSIEA